MFDRSAIMKRAWYLKRTAAFGFASFGETLACAWHEAKTGVYLIEDEPEAEAVEVAPKPVQPQGETSLEVETVAQWSYRTAVAEGLKRLAA